MWKIEHKVNNKWKKFSHTKKNRRNGKRDEQQARTPILPLPLPATSKSISPDENTLTLLELIIFAHSRDVVAVCLVVGLVDESNVVGSVHEMAVDAVLRCVQLQSIKKKGNWRENST
jgi:hypothetical protein